MSEAVPHISVVILTCNRLAWLERLLESLEDQTTEGKFTYSVRLVDNDPAQSARHLVERRAPKAKIQCVCDCEPEKNLAKLRNLGAVKSSGEFIAFIDDDEFPVGDWLLHLMETCATHQADGVLGPVRPHFETPPPDWILRSKVCERPSHRTGLVLRADQTRTGNVLLRRSIFNSVQNHFDEAFAMHGEDRDFFKRLIGGGHRFVWCEEAVAYETVPPQRWRRVYYIRRALLRGSVSWRNTRNHVAMLVKTLAAIGIYSISMPFLLLGGQGLFMRYFLKNCDHIGRIMAVCGMPVERFIITP